MMPFRLRLLTCALLTATALAASPTPAATAAFDRYVQQTEITLSSRDLAHASYDPSGKITVTKLTPHDNAGIRTRCSTTGVRPSSSPEPVPTT